MCSAETDLGDLHQPGAAGTEQPPPGTATPHAGVSPSSLLLLVLPQLPPNLSFSCKDLGHLPHSRAAMPDAELSYNPPEWEKIGD